MSVPIVTISFKSTFDPSDVMPLVEKAVRHALLRKHRLGVWELGGERPNGKLHTACFHVG